MGGGEQKSEAKTEGKEETPREGALPSDSCFSKISQEEVRKEISPVFRKASFW